MSYRCALTILNQTERKKKIMDMYSVACCTKSVECFCVVLMWMLEFICSYFYINTNEDINVKQLLKEQNLNSDDCRLLNIWVDFRNEIAHCVFPLNVQRLKDYLSVS